MACKNVIKYVSSYVIKENVDLMKNEFLGSIGAIGLNFRLKRLSDLLQKDINHLYKELEVPLEPSWFLVLFFLQQYGPTSVTAVGRGLGVSHPAIIQVSRELIAAEHVATYKDGKDKRKRVLALTSRGRAVFGSLAPVWTGLQRAFEQVSREIETSSYLGGLEKAFFERSLRERFYDHYVIHN